VICSTVASILQDNRLSTFVTRSIPGKRLQKKGFATWPCRPL